MLSWSRQVVLSWNDLNFYFKNLSSTSDNATQNVMSWQRHKVLYKFTWSWLLKNQAIKSSSISVVAGGTLGGREEPYSEKNLWILDGGNPERSCHNSSYIRNQRNELILKDRHMVQRSYWAKLVQTPPFWGLPLSSTGFEKSEKKFSERRQLLGDL